MKKGFFFVRQSVNFKFFLLLGTHSVIYHLLCQIVEHGGFYRTSNHTWVTIEKIQFVGACNLPTDPGRKPLSHRYGVGIN